MPLRAMSPYDIYNLLIVAIECSRPAVIFVLKKATCLSPSLMKSPILRCSTMHSRSVPSFDFSFFVLREMPVAARHWERFAELTAERLL